MFDFISEDKFRNRNDLRNILSPLLFALRYFFSVAVTSVKSRRNVFRETLIKKKIRSRGCLRHTPCFQWNEMLEVLCEHQANAWLEVGGKSSNRRDNSLPVIWQELPAGRGVFIAADGSYGRQCKMLSSFYFSQFGFFDLGGNVPWPLERADKDRTTEMTKHQASSEDIKNQIIKC